MYRNTYATITGDIIEIQIPPASTNPNQHSGASSGIQRIMTCLINCSTTEVKHKGFGFITFDSAGDAQDAIDNMDLNELRGRVVRVNLARPTKMPINQGLGMNKAST